MSTMPAPFNCARCRRRLDVEQIRARYHHRVYCRDHTGGWWSHQEGRVITPEAVRVPAAVEVPRCARCGSAEIVVYRDPVFPEASVCWACACAHGDPSEGVVVAVDVTEPRSPAATP